MHVIINICTYCTASPLVPTTESKHQDSQDRYYYMQYCTHMYLVPVIFLQYRTLPIRITNSHFMHVFLA